MIKETVDAGYLPEPIFEGNAGGLTALRGEVAAIQFTAYIPRR